MTEHRLGIIMNGVTGRMGTNQHLIRSILEFMKDGGIKLDNGDTVMPDPILVGRSAEKIEALAKKHGVGRWTTDLDGAIANRGDTLFFDSASTNLRAELLRKAIDAGKDIYCEKPSASTLHDAIEVYQRAEKAGVRHGVVQDKIFLPGLQKMKTLMDEGFFGRLLSVKIDFGYWVFEGDWRQSQRPSWNYRKEDGGGIILDMMPHWRYVLDNTFGGVKSISCLGRVNIDKRWDENAKPYDSDADDASYALVELEGGAVAQIFASWCTRVRKDDLVTFHADGTQGAAVAGLTKCYTQDRAATPSPIWNPDEPQTIPFFDTWQEYGSEMKFDNGFKTEWEMFIRSLYEDEPFHWNLREGAKGVQLAEAAMQSWQERRWIDIDEVPA
ncbi:MAG: D-xylose dehydrogenase [Alphaproteobacteria bacterium MarineAlpha11_Bin1]|nr:MAG: D-xylose dehydrogenase [Alphaproteobacteria bacterium MarineAlpha11_Bin1]